MHILVSQTFLDIFLTEEILHSSKAVWVAPGSKYFAYATFDDTQVMEHLITRWISVMYKYVDEEQSLAAKGCLKNKKNWGISPTLLCPNVTQIFWYFLSHQCDWCVATSEASIPSCRSSKS